MRVRDASGLRDHERENAQLKRLTAPRLVPALADANSDIADLKEPLSTRSDAGGHPAGGGASGFGQRPNPHRACGHAGLRRSMARNRSSS
jgi:hypothetical protein